MRLRKIAFLVLAFAVAVFPLAGIVAAGDNAARNGAVYGATAAGGSSPHVHASLDASLAVMAQATHHPASHHDTTRHGDSAAGGAPENHMSSCCDGAPCLSLAFVAPAPGAGLRIAMLSLATIASNPLRNLTPGVPKRPPRPVGLPA